MIRKEDLQNQKLQLDDLEAKLRETTERLKRLEANAKHRRGQSQNVLSGNGSGSGRPAVRPVVEENEYTETDDSGGDSRSEGEGGNRVSR